MVLDVRESCITAGESALGVSVWGEGGGGDVQSPVVTSLANWVMMG